ncbi:MAG: hypothetical protein ACFFER_16335 [Candidatus Thorarchaeota archaeon]
MKSIYHKLQEPLPEPFRTALLIVVVLTVLIIPLIACTITMQRRRTTRRIVEETGASWDEIDSKISKKADVLMDDIFAILMILFLICIGATFVLIQIVGPTLQDIAEMIWMSVMLLFVIVCCPIAMVWGVRVEDGYNAQRIRIAREEHMARETGQKEDIAEDEPF